METMSRGGGAPAEGLDTEANNFEPTTRKSPNRLGLTQTRAATSWRVEGRVGKHLAQPATLNNRWERKPRGRRVRRRRLGRRRDFAALFVGGRAASRGGIGLAIGQGLDPFRLSCRPAKTVA
eukprot:scaffold45520_cov64-Phaeocystis_antarctica.AAC.13